MNTLLHPGIHDLLWCLMSHQGQRGLSKQASQHSWFKVNTNSITFVYFHIYLHLDLYLLDIHRTPLSWRYACTIPMGELGHSDIWAQGWNRDWRLYSGHGCLRNTKERNKDSERRYVSRFVSTGTLFKTWFTLASHNNVKVRSRNAKIPCVDFFYFIFFLYFILKYN